MRRGKSWIKIPIYDDNDDAIIYELPVEWEYDQHGGNEKCVYWFDCWITEYPENASWELKNQLDQELTKIDMENIMNTEED